MAERKGATPGGKGGMCPWVAHGGARSAGWRFIQHETVRPRTHTDTHCFFWRLVLPSCPWPRCSCAETCRSGTHSTQRPSTPPTDRCCPQGRIISSFFFHHSLRGLSLTLSSVVPHSGLILQEHSVPPSVVGTCNQIGRTVSHFSIRTLSRLSSSINLAGSLSFLDSPSTSP